MSHIPKTLAVSLGFSALCVMPAYADGVDEMFTADGLFVDQLEIVGDVVMPSGEELALFEMRENHLKIYVNPGAAYVTVDPNNPVFLEQTPFYGFWISTQSPDTGDWPVCNWQMTDENGEIQPVFGSIVWTNTGIGADGYSIAFGIDMGTCDNPVAPWIYSRAAIEMSPDAGVPHGDIPDQSGYYITDSLGREYFVEAADGWAVLTSVDMRDIAVPMADAEQSTRIVHEQDILAMYQDCSAGSAHYGYGTWSWANGGFFIDCDTISFAFPRMDAPPENGGACRM